MALVVRATLTALGAHNGTILQLHGWNGWIPSLQAQPAKYQRLGQVGTGVQSVGTAGRPISCTAWRGESSDTVATAFCATWESLEGEVCQLLDPWARTLKRIRITGLSADPKRTRGPLIDTKTPVTVRIELSLTAERLPDA